MASLHHTGCVINKCFAFCGSWTHFVCISAEWWWSWETSSATPTATPARTATSTSSKRDISLWRTRFTVRHTRGSERPRPKATTSSPSSPSRTRATLRLRLHRCRRRDASPSSRILINILLMLLQRLYNLLLLHASVQTEPWTTF